MLTQIYMLHDPDELTPEIAETVRNSDILFLEFAGNNIEQRRRQEKIWNEVSRGETSVSELRPDPDNMYTEQSRKILSIIYKTKIKVYLERCRIDSGGYKPDITSMMDYFHENKVNEALRHFKRWCEISNELNIARDDDISHFLINLEQSNYNKISSSILGPAHTSVYHIVKRSGVNTRLMLPQRPYVVPMSTEIDRRYRFSKPVPEIMGLRLMASLDIARHFEISPSMRVLEKIRKSDEIAIQLSEEDIRDLSLFVSQNWWKDLPYEILQETVSDWLKDKKLV